MVIMDMVRHLRPLLFSITVISAVALVVPITAATGADRANSDSHSAFAAAKVTAPRAVADRTPRPWLPLVPVALLFAGLASLTLLLARHDRLIGRRMRRLHDVGHDWRSLLLGAPPALA